MQKLLTQTFSFPFLPWFMSCQTCTGCFTGSSCHSQTSARISSKERFHTLLELASTSQNENDSEQHDHVISTIASELSNNVYSAQVALIEAYRQLPLQDFLVIAHTCRKHDIVGAYVAWMWEYCGAKADQLLSTCKSPSDELWQYLDEKAEMHELFNSMPPGSLGRVKR